MGPLIYVSSPEKMTGSYALQLFQSSNSGEWALLLAAATLWTLPVVLLFFFAQRAFIQGIALTGMKTERPPPAWTCFRVRRRSAHQPAVRAF